MNMYDFEVEFKLWILLITGIIKFKFVAITQLLYLILKLGQTIDF